MIFLKDFCDFFTDFCDFLKIFVIFLKDFCDFCDFSRFFLLHVRDFLKLFAPRIGVSKNTSGHTLKVPSQNQSSELASRSNA